jgi:hypothetical protein
MIAVAKPLESWRHQSSAQLRSLRWAPVLYSFVLSRVIIVAAALTARALGSHADQRQGLLGWDSQWYLKIAEHGYAHIAPQGIRFFPLLPELVRTLAVPLAGHTAVALLLFSNLAARAYAVLASRVAVAEGFSRRQADLVPWVIAFSPAGFVLAMGYTEPLFGVLACAVFLGARRKYWAVVAVAGYLAGTLRPTGVVLVVPIFIEACRSITKVGARHMVPRVVAIIAPIAGLASYLAWTAGTRGDPLLPLRAQTEPGLRGGVVVNPLTWIIHDCHLLVSGGTSRQWGPLFHVIWAVVAIYLTVAVARRLPSSYTAFAALTVALGITARSMASFERYAASALPLVLIAAARIERTTTTRSRFVILAAAAIVLFAYSLTAFLHRYIP